jgi:hypothetical protein
LLFHFQASFVIAAQGSINEDGCCMQVEGLMVKYTGPGEDDTQAATIRTNFPVPADVPLYYFEVKDWHMNRTFGTSIFQLLLQGGPQHVCSCIPTPVTDQGGQQGSDGTDWPGVPYR